MGLITAIGEAIFLIFKQIFIVIGYILYAIFQNRNH